MGYMEGKRDEYRRLHQVNINFQDSTFSGFLYKQYLVYSHDIAPFSFSGIDASESGEVHLFDEKGDWLGFYYLDEQRF